MKIYSDVLIRNDTTKQYRNIRKILHAHTPVLEDKKDIANSAIIRYLMYFFIVLILVFIFSSCAVAGQSRIEGYTLNQWANAIYKAEGNDNYGILSIKYSTTEECRRICKNTVKNNYYRWKRSEQDITFMQFLQRRYCPIGCFNDPTGLNSNWAVNVGYWLRKG